MKVRFHLQISKDIEIDLPARQARKLVKFVDDRGDRCDSFNAEEWPEGVPFPWVGDIENQISDMDIEIDQLEIVPPKKVKAER